MAPILTAEGHQSLNGRRGLIVMFVPFHVLIRCVCRMSVSHVSAHVNLLKGMISRSGRVRFAVGIADELEFNGQ